MMNISVFSQTVHRDHVALIRWLLLQFGQSVKYVKEELA
jgi:hypothetical protein